MNSMETDETDQRLVYDEYGRSFDEDGLPLPTAKEEAEAEIRNDTWTEEDFELSATEGWALITRDGWESWITIMCLDTPDDWPGENKLHDFNTDAEAVAYVMGRAEAGCIRAQRALCLSQFWDKQGEKR